MLGHSLHLKRAIDEARCALVHAADVVVSEDDRNLLNLAVGAMETVRDHWDEAALLTPIEIRTIRKNLGLTQKDAGRMLGGGDSAFTKYESGNLRPAASMNNLLRLLDANPDLLAMLRQR